MKQEDCSLDLNANLNPILIQETLATHHYKINHAVYLQGLAFLPFFLLECASHQEGELPIW